MFYTYCYDIERNAQNAHSFDKKRNKGNTNLG